jgi:transketolase|tara:strand:+ start:127 stop:1014 length:888 start_codon:yes stop_codon:yes gene_type:complete
MSVYEKYLRNISKSKKVFILTAENKLALRSIPNNKILDVGICEQNLIGIASGIAKKGGKCFVHALSNFLVSRAYDFIKINLDYQKNSCILVGSMGGFLSTFNGPTHQSIDEIYLIGNLANFDVFFPATEYEMVLFIKKFNFSRSVYIRYNPINNKILNKVINKNYKPNKKLIGNGKNIIISYGVCSEQIFKILHENKFLKNKFKLYNFSLITNLNKTFFLYLAKKSNNLLIVEDHVNKGSLSEKIKVLLYENKIKINLISKNLGNKYFQPKKTLDELFKKYDITKKYLENLNFKQ